MDIHNPLHTRNKSESRYIDAKFKNKHRRSRNKLPPSRKAQYSLNNYLNLNDCQKMLDVDYSIFNHDFCHIDIWTCPRCTYCNIEGSSYCKICEFSNFECNNGLDCVYAPLSQYVIKPKKTKTRKNKRKKIPKKFPKSDIFRFDDENFVKFKKFMKQHETSIIAYRKEKNDGNDGWRQNKMERAQKKSMKLYQMYKKVYFAESQNKSEIAQIIQNMASLIPKKYLKCAIPHHSSNTICRVCFADTQKEESLKLVTMNKYCSHSMICSECFTQYVNVQITQDEHILPWILCPAQDCKAPIAVDLLLQYASTNNLYKFALSFLYKHLHRCSSFVECPDSNSKQCKFGWLILDESVPMDETLECEACGCLHKREPENDDGFADMISKGILRECPRCSYPAMKDYGMCNVMHCVKCNVYWNWRTKEVGSSSNEVKQKARANGTLWEQGELAYQQSLQRNNLPEFIALLSRNGIKYDPNYQRGT